MNNSAIFEELLHCEIYRQAKLWLWIWTERDVLPRTPSCSTNIPHDISWYLGTYLQSYKWLEMDVRSFHIGIHCWEELLLYAPK